MSRLIRDAQESPLIKSVRELRDSPTMKLLRDIQDSPLMKSMRALQDSPMSRLIRDAQESPLMKSMRAFQDSPMAKLIRDAQESPLMKSMRAFQDSPMAKHMRDAQESSLMKSMRALQDSPTMKLLRDVQDSPLMKSMQAMQRSSTLQSIAKIDHGHSIRAIKSAISFDLESMSEVIASSSWLTIDEAFLTDFEPASDKTLTDDRSPLTREEINGLIVQATENAINKSDKQLQHFLLELKNEIATLKIPTLEKIIIAVLVPILVGIILSAITPVVDDYVKKHLGNQERQLVKDIKKSTAYHISREVDISDFRFVSTQKLPIRVNPSARSPKIGQLVLGDTVTLVKKNKDWTLVTWQDQESEATIQGWVFSRYLKKFR